MTRSLTLTVGILIFTLCLFEFTEFDIIIHDRLYNAGILGNKLDNNPADTGSGNLFSG